MAAHRTAVLRHDAVGQETLLNLLLRSYLNYNLYDQVRTTHGSVPEMLGYMHVTCLGSGDPGCMPVCVASLLIQLYSMRWSADNDECS